MKKHKGFTLIELPMVIAIIVILAAILFPVFARARENARRASCQSNLKQIGLSLAQYTQDYDEKLPPAWGYTSSWGSYNPGIAWDLAIAPYTGTLVKRQAGVSSSIFLCPSDTVKRDSYNEPPVTYAMPQLENGDPLSNNKGIAPIWTQVADGGYVSLGRNIASLESVADTIFLAEDPEIYATMGSPNNKTIPSPASQLEQFNGSVNVPRPATHFDGFNYLFVDGHVKWLRPEATKGTGTMTVPRGMWTIDAGD